VSERLVSVNIVSGFFFKARMEEITMMRNQLAISALALALSTSGFATAQPFAATASGSQYQDHDHDRDRDRDWNMPPQEFKDIQRQRYHDGIEGARKDYDNHRRPDVNNRDEYRHPHVPESARADYREGFRRGYETAWDHLMNNSRR
jgi:Spy/CpxP family protein refolding chaperone